MLEPRSSGILDVLTRITRDILRNMDPKLIAGDEIVWDKDLETLLFYAMHGMKPVGVNRHFMMAVISKRFGSYINKKNFDSQIIWDHLETLYDMAALHESEVIPFPNEEIEFELSDEFDEVAMERHGATIPHSQKDESETLKNNSKNMKRLSSAKLKPNATPNSKNTFQTPVSNKSTKNHRSDSRASSVESNAKTKQEPVSSGRGNKSSRASSPHSTKTAKSQTSTVESSATPVSASQKKTDLQENKDKKTPKNEPTPSSSKKTAKTETVSSSKQGKPDSSDSVGKKIKNEKESSSKKGKVSLTSESSSKKRESTKGESKREVESKRSSEASSAKSKSDKEKSSKSNKNEDADSTQSSGTRKSASLRVETDQKKRKRTEDSGKKETPPARRRRTANP